MNSDIRERIHLLKKERQWSDYKLARQAGIPQSTLTNLTSRGNDPTLQTLSKIAVAFNMTLLELLDFDNNMVSLTDENKEFIHCLRRMTPIQRENLLMLLKVIIAN